MKKNSFFFIYSWFILLLIFGSKLYSQDKKNLKGLDLCNYTADYLEKQNCDFSIIPLVYNESNENPFSILIHEKNIDYSSTVNQKLLYIFQMEDFIEYQDFFSKFIYQVENTDSNVETQIFLSYGDSSINNQPYPVSGTISLLYNNDETNLCVVYTRFTTENTFITPGSKGKNSPLWLLKLCTDSLSHGSFPYLIKGDNASMMYRMNILQNDENYGFLLNNDIPSILQEIKITPENEDSFLQSTKYFIENFSRSFKSEWDKHYVFFSLGPKTYYLSETFTLISFLAIDFFSLFFIFEFSFISRKVKIKKIALEVSKIWYFIPIFALINAFVLILGQGISYLLDKAVSITPLNILFIKFFFTFTFLSVLFFIFHRFFEKFTENTFAFLLTISGLINIFIFSAVDVSLIYVFTIEYILIYLSRPAKKAYSLVFFLIILALPYLLLLLQILNWGNIYSINTLLSGALGINLLISFVFVPFEMVVIRIYIQMIQKWRKANDNTRKFYKQNFYAVFAAVIITILLTTAIYFLIKPKETKQTEVQIYADIPVSQFISYADETYFGENGRIITINLPEQMENLRLSVTGSGKNSLLYSDDPYFTDAEHSEDIFIIPPYPTKHLKFRYISDNSIDSCVKIKSYKSETMMNGQKQLQFIEKELFIPGMGK